jgi:hypothetical protein
MENQTKQILADELEKILVDWEDDDACSPHRIQDNALAGDLTKILERLYSIVYKLSIGQTGGERIAVINAYTKGCYGWFTTDEQARNYMGQMLLKEAESHVEVCEFADHWIWVYDARGTDWE